MYKSPIDIIYRQMRTTIENDVVKAVQDVGINVDKEELIRALEYDRDQYNRGYEDGKNDSVVHGRWERSEYHGFLCCSECKDVYIVDEWLEDGKWKYCTNCGAKMDGDGNG